MKKYTRIVDNVTPDMVRTRDALAMTASYLYGLLDDRPEVPFMVKRNACGTACGRCARIPSLQAITESHRRARTDGAVRDPLRARTVEETATVTNPDGHNSHLNVERSRRRSPR